MPWLSVEEALAAGDGVAAVGGRTVAEGDGCGLSSEPLQPTAASPTMHAKAATFLIGTHINTFTGLSLMPQPSGWGAYQPRPLSLPATALIWSSTGAVASTARRSEAASSVAGS